MKKPHFDVKKKPYHNNRYNNNNQRASYSKPVEEFDMNKLNQMSDDVVEMFKLVQAIRYDRIQKQDEYNNYRMKLNEDRMSLETQLIKIKKTYNAKISALQEEYNSVKSNSTIELAKLRSLS